MSDAWDAVKKGAGDVGDTLFGTSSDPGWLGLGHQQIKTHNIDQNNYNDPNSAAMMQNLAGRTTGIDNRQAPTMEAAQQNGIREYNGANLAPQMVAGNATVGPSNSATTSTTNGVNVNRTDGNYAGGQDKLISSLQDAANGNGPSLATAQLNQATDRNIKQQMGVAAAQGGNPALAQRNAALGAATAGRQLGIDSANMKVQEQVNARNALGSVLGQAREQSIGQDTTQANLLQQANLANMNARNTTSQFNASAANTNALKQADLTQQGNQFNANQGNNLNVTQAQLQEQAGLASQSQFNQMLGQNTANRQAANQSNLESSLKTMGMNDAQIQFLLTAQANQAERDRQAKEQYEQDQIAQETGVAGASQQAYDASANARAQFVRNLTEQKVIGPTDFGGGKKDS